MTKFKKIASLLASAVMMSSTVGLAVAATYPSPFVVGGSPDVGIVYGTSGALTDLNAATQIMDNLNSYATSGSVSSGGTTTYAGENYPLFTSSTELFLNTTLVGSIDTLTDQQLPTLLVDGGLEGASSYTYEQRIIIGSNPIVTFAQMPTSDDDPRVGISVSTSPSTTPVYNATVIFDENANFTHADTVGEDITLFGQRFTVGAGTTNTKLILLKSSQTVDLSSDVNPSAQVTLEGAEYTIEITAATDTSATIKVTDSTGRSETKEITEATSKKVLGLELSVDLADENNNRVTATVSVGSNRITLQDGSAVKVGSDEDTLDGTNVEFYLANGTGTTYPGGIGKIDFQVSAVDSDNDAIFPGQSFVDPIFGSFKVDFTGLNVALDSTSERETISVSGSNDNMAVTFRSHNSNDPKSVDYIYNRTTAEGGGMILADSSGNPIRVAEAVNVNKSQYFVFASDNEGGVYEITRIYNSSSTTASDDEIGVQNVFNGETTTASATSEGTGTISLGGKTYSFNYNGAQTATEQSRQVRFNQPESGTGSMILFPTVKTSMGAKVAFYQPTTVNLENFNGFNSTAYAANVTTLSFPDGDGYTDVTVVRDFGGGTMNGAAIWNFTFGSTTRNVSTFVGAGVSSGLLTIGRLTYNVTGAGAASSNSTVVYLQNPEGGNIVRPALVIFEERDDSSNYEAMIVTADGGYDGADLGVGVADVIRTWGTDIQLGNEIQLETDSDLYQDMDWWGSLITLDKGDSDQITATISYPDEQLESMVYVAEVAGAGSGGTGGGGSGAAVGIPIADSEVASVPNKNLIVVGGSCVNSYAATLLGSSTPLCGADFTVKTNVGSGQFLVETFNRGGGSKVATLVAGYNAPDTVNAATYLRTQMPMTDTGKKYVGTSSTSAQLVTEAA